MNKLENIIVREMIYSFKTGPTPMIMQSLVVFDALQTNTTSFLNVIGRILFNE